MSELGLIDRLEGRAARWAAGLPPAVHRAVLRKPPVVVDGDALDPGIQLILALREVLRMPSVVTQTPAEARARARRDAMVHAGAPIAVGAVRDLAVAGATGPLRARHYAPANARGPRPLIVYFHGGGFVIGDLETHDPACRWLCRHADAHVLAVEYRLAPEHPFPAPVDDALAAFRWAVQNAASLGADSKRVAVAGDSAGGNLAANVARLSKARGGPQPALQVLIYPTVDRTRVTRSMELFGEGYFLTRAEIDWYQAHYTNNQQLDHPDVSPLVAKDLGGLAPALVLTAAFDPLRDEGEAYADALVRSGTNAVHVRAKGLIHGFINMIALNPASRGALMELSASARSMLAG